MLYSVVLVSAIHQHESATGMHMTPPSGISLSLPTPSHPSGLSQSTRLSSLRHSANSHQLSILYMVVYVFQCDSLHSCHPLLFLLWPQVKNKHLSRSPPGLATRCLQAPSGMSGTARRGIAVSPQAEAEASLSQQSVVLIYTEGEHTFRTRHTHTNLSKKLRANPVPSFDT